MSIVLVRSDLFAPWQQRSFTTPLSADGQCLRYGVQLYDYLRMYLISMHSPCDSVVFTRLYLEQSRATHFVQDALSLPLEVIVRKGCFVEGWREAHLHVILRPNDRRFITDHPNPPKDSVRMDHVVFDLILPPYELHQSLWTGFPRGRFLPIFSVAKFHTSQVGHMEAHGLEVPTHRPVDLSHPLPKRFLQEAQQAMLQHGCPRAQYLQVSLAFNVQYAPFLLRQTSAMLPNGNLSNTALQQAEVAAALSQGRISAALGQVLAHQTAMEASRARQAELARLEWLAEWQESRMRANGFARTMQGAALRNRAALRDGLLFRVPSFYR